MCIRDSFDDPAQVGVLALPAQIAHDGVATGDENIGVAGTARPDDGRNGMAGYLAGGLNNFLDAEAAAVAQVVLAAAAIDRAQGQDMGCLL